METKNDIREQIKQAKNRSDVIGEAYYQLPG
jgi:hypothetical protein